MDNVSMLYYTTLMRTTKSVSLVLDIAEHLGWAVGTPTDCYHGFELFSDKDVMIQKYTLKAWIEKMVQLYGVTRIVVEDVYEGSNFDTVRRLLTLATAAMDVAYEMSLDFKKYQNSEWKATIRSLSTQYDKGYNDKITVQSILSLFGFESESEDETDAICVLIHDNYVQKGDVVSKVSKKTIKISNSNLKIIPLVEANRASAELGLREFCTVHVTNYVKNIRLLKQVMNIAMDTSLEEGIIFDISDTLYLGVDMYEYKLPLNVVAILVVPLAIIKGNRVFKKFLDTLGGG